MADAYPRRIPRLDSSGVEQGPVLTGKPPLGPQPVVPLIRFLRHPQLNAVPPGRLTVWRWLGWLCVLLLVAFSIGVVVDGALAHAFGWKVAPTAFLRYLSAHPSMAAAMIVVLAPILEELAFRAFLSTSAKAVFIGLAFFLLYVCGLVHASIWRAATPTSVAIDHYFAGLWILIPTGIASLLLYLFAREPVLALFRRRGAWIFWISCVVFGAAHAADFTRQLAWWGFVLALPQFLVGVGLGYLRITFGLPWSMATHMAYDWLLISLVWSGLVLPTGGAGKPAWSLAVFALSLFVLVYGLVVLTRIARRCW